VGRMHDRFGVAADLRALFVEDAALAPERIGAAPHVPVVGVAGHDAERDLLAATADHQFGVRALHGLGLERRVAQRVELPAQRRPALEDVADTLLRVRHEVIGDAGGVPAGRLGVPPQLSTSSQVVLVRLVKIPNRIAQPSLTMAWAAASCCGSAQAMSTSPAASRRSGGGLNSVLPSYPRIANTMTPARSWSRSLLSACPPTVPSTGIS